MADVRVLTPGARVRIDAPRVTPNHGRQGVVVAADRATCTVLLDGEADTWLFGRSAVQPLTASVICLKGHIAEFGPTLEFPAAADIVYVGRPAYQGGWRLPGSMFANPFRAQRVGGAAKAVELYRQWLRGQPHLVALARERLRGKRLGCWCVNGSPCHAAALAEIAEGAAP